MQRRTLFATSILSAFAASAAKAKDLPALAPSVTDEVVPCLLYTSDAADE